MNAVRSIGVGVGTCAPGMPDWGAARDVLRGERDMAAGPAAEARRAAAARRPSGARQCRGAPRDRGRDAGGRAVARRSQRASIASVFATGDGDGEVLAIDAANAARRCRQRCRRRSSTTPCSMRRPATGRSRTVARALDDRVGGRRVVRGRRARGGRRGHHDGRAGAAGRRRPAVSRRRWRFRRDGRGVRLRAAARAAAGRWHARPTARCGFARCDMASPGAPTTVVDAAMADALSRQPGRAAPCRCWRRSRAARAVDAGSALCRRLPRRDRLHAMMLDRAMHRGARPARRGDVPHRRSAKATTTRASCARPCGTFPRTIRCAAMAGSPRSTR